MVQIGEGRDLAVAGSEKKKGVRALGYVRREWTRSGALYIGPLARHHIGTEKRVSQHLLGTVNIEYNDVVWTLLKSK
ncbi:hypothetical protein PanWU01x14_307090, partial [Parasponia andersonii]